MARARADDLLGLIYDTVAAPQQWQAVLETLAARMGARAATLVLLDTEARETQLALGVGALDAAALARYGDEFGKLDPAPAAFARVPIGTTAATDDLFEPAQRARDAFLNEYLRPLGLEECLGATLLKDARRVAQVGILRGRDRRPYGRRDHAALEAVVPHIRRALQLHRQLAALNEVAAALGGVVDTLPGGMIVLDGEGRAVLLNRAAEDVVARGDGLGVGRDGRIALAAPGAQAELDALLGGVLAGTGAGGPLRVPRRDGRAPYAMLISPQPRRIAAAAADRAAPLRGALAMIHDPDRVVQTPAAVLRTVLGLTPREAELAVALCAGSEPSGFAAAAGVSTNTVRFHLKSIYAKTGARGQADLIRRISATLASLGRVGAAPAGRGRQP